MASSSVIWKTRNSEKTVQSIRSGLLRRHNHVTPNAHNDVISMRGSVALISKRQNHAEATQRNRRNGSQGEARLLFSREALFFSSSTVPQAQRRFVCRSMAHTGHCVSPV